MWVVEFLSRNEEFMTGWKRFVSETWVSFPKKHPGLKDELERKYQIFLPRVTESNIGRFQKSDKPFIGIPSAVTANRLFGRRECAASYYHELDINVVDDDPHLVAFRMNCTAEPSVGDAEDLLEGLLGEPSDGTGLYPCGDTLLVAINLNRSRRDIEGEIKTLLDTHKQRKPGSYRPHLWRMYLVTYDLKKKNPNLTFDAIAGILSETFDEEALLDARNIENYYRNAIDLIQGGYTKYL